MTAQRPYIICHMGPSVDGRIAGMGELRSLSAAYERTAETFDADGWIIGRISMEPYAGKSKVPRRKVRIPRKDFVGDAKADSFAIAIDPSGKLTWKSNAIDGEHVIAILSEGVRMITSRFCSRKVCPIFLAEGRASISGACCRNSARASASRRCCSKAAAKSMAHFSPRI